MPHDSLHTVFLAAKILGIHCNGCGHRAVLRAAELPKMKNNITLLRSLKLRCKNCALRGTGKKQFTLSMPRSAPGSNASHRLKPTHNEDMTSSAVQFHTQALIPSARRATASESVTSSSSRQDWHAGDGRDAPGWEKYRATRSLTEPISNLSVVASCSNPHLRHCKLSKLKPRQPFRVCPERSYGIA